MDESAVIIVMRDPHWLFRMRVRTAMSEMDWWRARKCQHLYDTANQLIVPWPWENREI